MADQNSEKLHIRLHVYDEEIEVVVNRSEEEFYRAAGKLITDRYNTYAKLYKGRKSDHTIALMAMIDIAFRYQKERARNDVAPFMDVLTSLTEEIEVALGEKTK